MSCSDNSPDGYPDDSSDGYPDELLGVILMGSTECCSVVLFPGF